MTTPPADDDLLAAAARIGDRLVRDAIWHEGACTWIGAAMDQVGGRWQLVHRSCAGDLYEGTSGIAVFLGRLWQRTGERRHRAAALGAIRHALGWLRRTRLPDRSLYGGAAGVAWAAAAVAASAGAGGLRDDALGLARQLASSGAGPTARGAGPPASDAGGGDAVFAGGHDLMGGAAGVVAALADLARPGDCPELLERAEDIAARLVAEAHDDGVGLSWPVGGEEPGLCGLGHGAAGVAAALLELHAVTGDGRWLDAARAAERYERTWFDPEQLNWPDLRGVGRGGADRTTQPAYSCFWCHGAAGVGLERLRSHRIDGCTAALADAGAALQTALHVAEASGAATGFGSNPSVCHGLAATADLFAFAADVLAQPGLRDRAVATARRLAAIADGTEPAWPSGVTGGGESPGLMLGWSGVGAVLLRLAPDAAQPPVGLPCASSAG